MMSKFAEVVPAKMAEAGLEVDCHVCGKDDQAEFFFDAIAKMNTPTSTSSSASGRA